MLRNTAKILTLAGRTKISLMNNKALKIFYAVFMALVLVAMVVFMIIHIRAGLDGQNAKILLAGYILLIIWASARLFTLVRDLISFRK